MGGRYDTDNLRTDCCTYDESTNNYYNCIMTCSGSTCTNTKNGDNSSFPEDACPEKNRGVMCDTRLGYTSKGLNDWCCTEADVTAGNCTTTCENKCSGSTGITNWTVLK